MHVADVSTILMVDSFCQISAEDTQQTEDISDLNGHLENLTKAPIPNVLEYQANPSTKTKSAALNAKNLATCKRIVQN